MHGIDSLEDVDGADTVFRDVIFLALAGFVAVVLMLLPHLSNCKMRDRGSLIPPENDIAPTPVPTKGG